MTNRSPVSICLAASVPFLLLLQALGHVVLTSDDVSLSVYATRAAAGAPSLAPTTASAATSTVRQNAPPTATSTATPTTTSTMTLLTLKDVCPTPTPETASPAPAGNNSNGTTGLDLLPPLHSSVAKKLTGTVWLHATIIISSVDNRVCNYYEFAAVNNFACGGV